MIALQRVDRLVLTAVVGLFSATWLGGVAFASVGSAQDAGDVVVVQPNAALRELEGAGSATPFSLRLPEGANCPGDTRNDQWSYQTFMIPANDDPATLSFSAAGPTGSRQYALYEVNTSPLVDAILVPNLEPGQPALIPPLPPLTFDVFPPGEIEGSYRIGVACTFLRESARFWDTEIVATRAEADEPGQFTWRIANRPAVATESDPSMFPALALAILAAVALFLYTIRRRNGRHQTSLKEPS